MANVIQHAVPAVKAQQHHSPCKPPYPKRHRPALLTSMSILRKTAFASTIRPPREFLRQAPGRTVKLLFRRGSTYTARVAVTAAVEKSTARRSRTSCEDSSRLLGIMAFEPLRDAFGDFCHKSLCGEVSLCQEITSYEGIQVDAPEGCSTQRPIIVPTMHVPMPP